MADDLLHYYERELTFLRRSGARFARKYPRVASRLMLEANKCDDPHVERFLEGAAFLAARVHLKLDEDFPEISEALLDVVYPQHVRPVPSMGLVQIHPDPEQGKLTSGLEIPRGTPLYSRPVDGVPCRFQTCYDTTLWPLSVGDAGWCGTHELDPPIRGSDAVGAIRIRVDAPDDLPLNELEIERLRLHIHAESTLGLTLYEILCSNADRVVVRPSGPGSHPALGGCRLTPVGFEEDQGLLPHPRRSFLPYRLLQEYFVFPDKYLFVDVEGLGGLAATDWEGGFEIVVLVRPFEGSDRTRILESGVHADTFRLGCTPIINLFQKTSEPILLTHKRHEYPIVADARRRESTRIYSVDEVSAVSSGRSEPVHFQPLYSLRHAFPEASRDRIMWYARRRVRAWDPGGDTDMGISFVDEKARMVRPGLDAVTARLTCTNGDLPAQLPFGHEEGDFELPGGGPIDRVVALVKPTSSREPALGKAQLWRLISQLSLNFVSLVDGGPDPLREVLRLHNTGDEPAGEKQIQGIRAIEARPTYARIQSDHGLTFARGNRVEITFDEEYFAGGSVYLFASVLERFLGLSVSMNSFCVLVARTLQRNEKVAQWAPRAGRKVLL